MQQFIIDQTGKRPVIQPAGPKVYVSRCALKETICLSFRAQKRQPRFWIPGFEAC